jgi:hypothetical protein
VTPSGSRLVVTVIGGGGNVAVGYRGRVLVIVESSVVMVLSL